MAPYGGKEDAELPWDMSRRVGIAEERGIWVQMKEDTQYVCSLSRLVLASIGPDSMSCQNTLLRPIATGR